jgi:DNA polymerase (family 10)
MMQNEEIAGIFDDVADMLEIGGENFFRVRAYRNAARAVRDFPVAIGDLPRDRFREIPGFGADLASKLAVLLETGDLPIRIELMRTFPIELRELKHLPGLGPKRIKLLADRLGIRNREELKHAIEAGLLRTIHGFGARMEERLRSRRSLASQRLRRLAASVTRTRGFPPMRCSTICTAASASSK